EVSHGPTLVDNNIFLSDRALKLATQGVALIHNIIYGGIVAVGKGTNNGAPTKPSPRYTPYHVPHRTEIAGFMTILHGDTKIYNNIFVQQPIRPALKKGMDNNIATNNDWDDGNILAGTFVYENFPTFEKWNAQFEGYCGQGAPTTDKYYAELPVWTGGNIYLNGARPMSKEKEPDAVVIEGKKVEFSVNENADGFEFKTNLYEVIGASATAPACKLLHTDDIMMAFEPEQKYENPDGSPITFDEDFLGKKRVAAAVIPGPFAEAKNNHVITK
nr:hypothetical protein [Treponema sp.]